MKITKPRVALFNLGCKVNRYETDAVGQQFASAGYAVVGYEEEADVYVLNTCSVTGEAGRKSGQLLRRARKRNPEAVVVVMGCHVQLGGPVDEADIVVGTQGKSRVFAAVEHFRALWALDGYAAGKRPKQIDLIHALDLVEAPDFEEFGSVDQQSETRAYIKIQDGCNNFCSYCAIPLARGRVRSRSEEIILREAEQLAEAGFKEVVLTGIHVCSYGKERQEDSTALTRLCAKIASIEGIERIRLGSLEPLSVTPEFIRQAAENEKLCPHFHLSLQSGCPETLRRMRRRYTADQYRAVVEGLRTAYGTKLGLTTDVIVGFPGETEEEFAESFAFCEEMAFTRMHIFRYSERAGTAAVNFSGKVSPAVSTKRASALAKLAENLQMKHQQARVGDIDRIILEQKNAEGYFEGYTPNYDLVTLSWQEASLATGQVVSVELFLDDKNALRARPV